MAPNLPKVDWLTRGCGYMSSHLVLCSMARGRGLSDHKGLLNDNESLDGTLDGRAGLHTLLVSGPKLEDTPLGVLLFDNQVFIKCGVGGERRPVIGR